MGGILSVCIFLVMLFLCQIQGFCGFQYHQFWVIGKPYPQNCSVFLSPFEVYGSYFRTLKVIVKKCLVFFAVTYIVLCELICSVGYACSRLKASKRLLIHLRYYVPAV